MVGNHVSQNGRRMAEWRGERILVVSGLRSPVELLTERCRKDPVFVGKLNARPGPVESAREQDATSSWLPG
jgi:hypothetical protein